MFGYDDLSGLAPYLAEFGFGATPTAPAAPQMDVGVTLGVQALQAGLNLRGFKGKTGKPLVEDGAWGPNTQFALQAFTKANKPQYPAAQASLASPSTVFLVPTPFANILVGALQMSEKGRKLLGLAPSSGIPVPLVRQGNLLVGPTASLSTPARNAVSGGVITPMPGKEVLAVRDAQTIVRSLGANVAVDNKLGPATMDAWAWAAMNVRLPGFMEQIAGDPFRVFVDANTASMLRVKARNTRNPKMLSIAQVRAALKKGPPAVRPAAVPPPPPKPAASSAPMTARLNVMPAEKGAGAGRSGLTDTNVGTAQDILIKLGMKIGKRDGKYGPTTKAAWVGAAIARKLPPDFDRAGPLNAWVDPQTLTELTRAAGERVKPAGSPPPSAKTATSDGKPTAPSRPGLTQIKILGAQLMLNKLGARIKADNAFGAATKSAWAAAAKRRSAKPDFDRAGPDSAWVDPTTLAVLEKAADGAQLIQPNPNTPSGQPVAITSTATKLSANALVKQATTVLLVKTLQQAMMMANISNLPGQFPGVKDDSKWGPITEKGFYTLFNIGPDTKPTWAAALKQLVAASKKTVRLLPEMATAAGELSKLWLTRNMAAPAPLPGAVQASAVDVALSKANTLVPVETIQKALVELFYKQQAQQIPASPAIPQTSVTGSWETSTDGPPFWAALGPRIFNTVPSIADKEAFLATAGVLNAPLNGFRGLRGLRGFRGFGDTVTPTGITAIRLPSDAALLITQIAQQYDARVAPTPQAPAADSPAPAQQGDTQYIDGQAPGAVYNPSPQPAPQPQMAPEQDLSPSIPTPMPAPMLPTLPAYTPSAGGPAPQAVYDQPTADASLAPGGSDSALAPAPAAPEAAAPSSGGSIALVLGLIGVGTLAVIAMNKNKKGAVPPPKKKGRF